MKSLDIIEAVRKTTDTGSDYAVAKKLGVNRQSMTKYLHAGMHLSDLTTIRAAKSINTDPEKAVIEIQIERAKDEDLKQVLRNILAKLSATAASVALVFGLLTAPSEALASGANKQAQDLPIVMIMRSYILEL